MPRIILSEDRKKKIEETVLQEVLEEITEIEVEKGEIPRPPNLYLVKHQNFIKRFFAAFIGISVGLFALKIAISISTVLAKKGWFIG